MRKERHQWVNCEKRVVVVSVVFAFYSKLSYIWSRGGKNQTSHLLLPLLVREAAKLFLVPLPSISHLPLEASSCCIEQPKTFSSPNALTRLPLCTRLTDLTTFSVGVPHTLSTGSASQIMTERKTDGLVLGNGIQNG